MLISPDESLIVHRNFGDSRFIWLCDTATRQTRTLQLTEQGGVDVFAGTGEFFGVRHYLDNDIVLAAHHFTNPGEAVSHISFIDGAWNFEGDLSAWTSLPHIYRGGAGLLLLDIEHQTVEEQGFPWWDDTFHDKEYGIGPAVEIPGQDLAVVAPNRAYCLVLHDLRTQQAVVKFQMPLSGGAPDLYLRRTKQQLWVKNYDAILQYDIQNWNVARLDTVQPTVNTLKAYLYFLSKIVQVSIQRPITTWSPSGIIRSSAGFIGAGATMLLLSPLLPRTHLPLGDWSFNRNESACAVARPYSNDIVLINTESFEITHRAIIGEKPYHIALLNDRQVFVRQDRTGELLDTGRWQPFSL